MPGTVYKGDLAEVSFATETGFTLVHGTDGSFEGALGDTSFTFTSGVAPFFDGSNRLMFPKDILVGSQFVLTGQTPVGSGDNAADGRVFTITGNDGNTLNFSPALLAGTGTSHSLHVLPYKTPPVDALNNAYASSGPTENVLTDQFLGIATALTLPETKVDLKRYHVVGLGRDTAVQVPGKFITEGGSFEVAMHTARWLKYCLGNEISTLPDSGTTSTLNGETKVGATSVTLADASSFAVGNFIHIKDDVTALPVVLDHEPITSVWDKSVDARLFDNAYPHEIRRIVGKRGNVIFLDEPLAYDHTTGRTVSHHVYNAGNAPSIAASTCAITNPVTHLLFARSHTPSFSLEVSHRRLDKDADTVNDGGVTDAKTLTRVFRGCKVTDFTLSTDNDAALRLAVNFNSALCYTDAGRLENPGTSTDRYDPHRLFDDTANNHVNRLNSGIGLGTQKPFMFYDGSINIAGVQAGKVLNFTLSGQTGIQAFHTINGSTQNSGTADEAVPFGGSRNTALMVEGKTSYELSLEVMVDDPLFFNKMRSATEFSVHKTGATNGQIVIEFEKPLGNTAAGNSERMVILIDEYYIVEAPLQIPEDKGVVKSQLKVMPKSMRVLSRDTLLKY